MSKYDALEGLDDLVSRVSKKKDKKEAVTIPPKPKKKTQPSEDPEGTFPDNKEPGTGRQIVRSPRMLPAKAAKKVNEVKDGAARGIVFGPGALGDKKTTQIRRETIINWLLDGHTLEGETLTLTELAQVLGVPKETVEYDLAKIKDQMAAMYEDKHNKEMPIMAYMLMEMKMQDRGRALTIHNLIMDDIEQADANSVTIIDPDTLKKKRLNNLTGRDRAAMYSSALQALDLAQKATNGLDNIFKVIGGPDRIKAILQSKALQGTGKGGHKMATIGDVQEALSQLPEFRSILPSSRKLSKLPQPGFIDVTPEEQELMKVGQQAREKKQRGKQVPASKDEE